MTHNLISTRGLDQVGCYSRIVVVVILAAPKRKTISDLSDLVQSFWFLLKTKDNVSDSWHMRIVVKIVTLVRASPYFGIYYRLFKNDKNKVHSTQTNARRQVMLCTGRPSAGCCSDFIAGCLYRANATYGSRSCPKAKAVLQDLLAWPVEAPRGARWTKNQSRLCHRINFVPEQHKSSIAILITLFSQISDTYFCVLLLHPEWPEPDNYSA